MKHKLFWSTVVAVGVAVTLPASSYAQETQAPKDRQCVKHCRDGARACVAAATEDARLCRHECRPLLDAAKDACAAAADSIECQTARDAAHACIQKCGEIFKDALAECRGGGRECLAACPKPPPPKDPACLKDCRATLGDCLAMARTAARDCAGKCEPAVAAARDACAPDYESEACQAARQEAYACLRPCREALASDTGVCATSAHDCVVSCPNLPPTTSALAQ